VYTDHRELIAIGTKTIQPYYNSGAPDFPFEPIQGSMMELGGIAGTFAKLDNSWFWVHEDDKGYGQVWRAEGYRPVRVSDTAVEYALQSLSDLGSAYAWAYQEHGHLYYLITTPTATSTWCYDVLTGLWHERAYWTGSAYQRHRGRCYCRAFGKHLVGDHTNGKVYELSTSYTSDAGDSIRFLRTAPHLHNENKRMFYSRLELHMETGATDPTTIYMRWSNDSGRNYSTAVSTTTGASGATGTRVYWNRLGSARDRVFEVYGLAAGRVGIFGASLDLEPGIS